VGFDRDLRRAGCAALNTRDVVRYGNKTPYMTDIPAPRALGALRAATSADATGACGACGVTPGSLKNQTRARVLDKSFFAFALNIGFFLCYFRRRVELADESSPRLQTPVGD
jgi:hypothetical protein